MKFSNVMATGGEWLRGEGPHHQIVISSRVRLARNLPEEDTYARAELLRAQATVSAAAREPAAASTAFWNLASRAASAAGSPCG